MLFLGPAAALRAANPAPQPMNMRRTCQDVTRTALERYDRMPAPLERLPQQRQRQAAGRPASERLNVVLRRR